MKKTVLAVSVLLTMLLSVGGAFAMKANIHTDMEMKWKIDPATLSNKQFGKFVNDKSVFNTSMSMGQTSYKIGFKPASGTLDQMNYTIKFSDMFTWGGGKFTKSLTPVNYDSKAWGFGFYFKPAKMIWLSLQTLNDGADYLELVPAIQIQPISILSLGVQFDYSMNTNTAMKLGVDFSVKPKPLSFCLESQIGLGSTTTAKLYGYLDASLGKTLNAGSEFEFKNITSTNLTTIISPYVKTKVASVSIKPQLDLTITPSVDWAFDVEFAYDFDPLNLNTESDKK